MAMSRRPRQGGGRHPPPLAPTVSNFKPRAQWTNSGSSVFLYVNLPGFYRDQIEIKKDERTRTVQIQGQRPLSTQTWARFNETYKVPEFVDLTKSKTSFSHGLLTIEFQAVQKPEKVVQDQGKIIQKPNQEESRRPGLNGSSLGLKKLSNEEKQVGTSQEKAPPKLDEKEPRTYKSVVEGKKPLPTRSREKSSEQKVKEGEASPSLRLKERVKEEKAVVERKEVDQLGQQKTVQKKKEEEARSTPKVGGSLNPKVRGKEEKVTEREKDASIGQNKNIQKVKEKEGSSLDLKVNANGDKVVERKIDGGKGQKVKEEGKIILGQKKQEQNTKPIVGDETRTTEEKTAATNREEDELKTKENVNGNGNVKIKQDEKTEKMAEGEIQKIVQQKKIEETGLAKEPRKVDLDELRKKESAGGGESREKMVEKSLESETDPLLVGKGQNKTDMDPSAVGGRSIGEEEEESQKKYDISLVNVGVAALVIMGFGAYIFIPLVKLFF